jgi:hypothetical protein
MMGIRARLFDGGQQCWQERHPRPVPLCQGSPLNDLGSVFVHLAGMKETLVSVICTPLSSFIDDDAHHEPLWDNGMLGGGIMVLHPVLVPVWNIEIMECWVSMSHDNNPCSTTSFLLLWSYRMAASLSAPLFHRLGDSQLQASSFSACDPFRHWSLPCG